MFSCNLPPALGATVVTQGWNGDRKWVSTKKKVDPGEENSPAAPAGIWTRDLSITSPVLVTTELSCSQRSSPSLARAAACGQRPPVPWRAARGRRRGTATLMLVCCTTDKSKEAFYYMLCQTPAKPTQVCFNFPNHWTQMTYKQQRAWGTHSHP